MLKNCCTKNTPRATALGIFNRRGSLRDQSGRAKGDAPHATQRDFEAFGRFLETANPFAFWAQVAQVVAPLPRSCAYSDAALDRRLSVAKAWLGGVTEPGLNMS